MMKYCVKVTAVFAVLVLSGCGTLRYKQTYSHIAPISYLPVSNTMVFEYSDLDINTIYKDIFSDFLIIGQSGFSGSYEDPLQAKAFAASIGADVLITSSTYLDTSRSVVPFTTPVASTTTVRGQSANGVPVYGSAITWGSQTTLMPVTTHRYANRAYFLKNVNKVEPVWEYTKDDYLRTRTSIYDGVWKNEQYKVLVYQSENKVVAVLQETPKNKKLKRLWVKDDFKMSFSPNTGKGLFLLDSKQPIRAEFSINDFNHLVMNSLFGQDAVSFQKVKDLPELKR